MTLADNARRLQGRDDPALVVAMASASFTRDAPVMRDMGFAGVDLDALVAKAGDAILGGAGGSDGPPPDFAPGDEGDQGRLDQIKPIVCPNCAHEFQRSESA
jgi:hypothetical protein